MARRHKRNRRRRKGRFAFLYKLLAFLLICGAIVAALAVFFKVSQVEISGNSRYTREEILESSGVKIGANLFLLNKYEVAERICSRLPYVSAVRLSRYLPDTLQIEVSECTDALGIVQDGKLWLICDTGKIVDCVAAEQKEKYGEIVGLTLLDPAVGKTIESEKTSVADQLLTILEKLNDKGMLGQVQEINLSDSGMITMRYADAFDVQLPWRADYDYKLDYLAAVIEKLEENEKGTIILMQDGEARFIPR